MINPGAHFTDELSLMNINTTGEIAMDRIYNQKVLVVEDDPESEALLVNIVKSVDPNIDLTCTNTAEEAHEILKNSHYDLVIADHYLDGATTGYELWKTCRNDHLITPFIMASGLKTDEYLQLNDYDKGYLPFFQKPYKKEDLKEMIAWFLGKPSSVSDTPRVLSGDLYMFEEALLSFLLVGALLFTIVQSDIEIQKSLNWITATIFSQE